MPGVHFGHLDTTRLSLVGSETPELGKAPGVHPALSLTLAVGDSFSDVREVLKHDGAARGGVLYKAFLLFPVGSAQKSTVGGDSRVIESQVHTDHLFGLSNGGSGLGDDDMQEVAPVAVAQISRTDRPADILPRVFGNGEVHFLTPGHAGKATGKRCPLDPI